MPSEVPDDWPLRVRAALEIGDVRGPKASDTRRGPDRIAGLAKALGWSPAKVGRWLKRTDWEDYELEGWLRRVADAAELPYEFFTVRWETLGPIKQPEHGPSRTDGSNLNQRLR